MKWLYFIFLYSSNITLGQQLSSINDYLTNKQISKSAKDYYFGKFRPSDDRRTFSIIDSLKTKNDSTRPFYLLLVSKMLLKSDGALAEELGIECKSLMESHPNNLIDFLYSKNKLISQLFIEQWADIIAGEFMIDCEGKERECIKKTYAVALRNTRPDNKSRLYSIYKKIYSYCHK